MLKQKGDELNFFEITEEAKKILSFISAETVGQQIEVESEESNIHIMEKYWNQNLGEDFFKKHDCQLAEM